MIKFCLNLNNQFYIKNKYKKSNKNSLASATLNQLNTPKLVSLPLHCYSHQIRFGSKELSMCYGVANKIIEAENLDYRTSPSAKIEGYDYSRLDEAKAIVKTGYNTKTFPYKKFIQKRYLSFLTLDEKALYVDFSPADVAKIKRLTVDKEVSSKDAVTCVAYDLSDKIEDYKKIKKEYKELEPTEIALHLLNKTTSPKEIKRYLSLRDKDVKYRENGEKKFYRLAPDELIRCIKNCFDDVQISRYAKLRNREFDYSDDLVRDIIGKQKYPAETVFEYVKKDVTDKELEDRKNFFYFLDLGHPIDFTTVLMRKKKLLDQVLLRKEYRTGSHVSEDIVKAALLSNHIDNIIGLTEKESAPCEDETEKFELEFAKLKKANNSYNDSGVIDLLQSRFKKKLVYFKSNYLFRDNEEIKRFENLMKDYKKYRINNLGAVERRNYDFLIKKGYDYYVAIDLCELNHEQIQRYNKIIKQSIDDAISGLSKAQIDECNKMIKQGIGTFDAIDIVSMDSTQKQRYDFLTSKDMQMSYAIEIAQFSDEEYERYNEYLRRGVESHCAYKMATYDYDDIADFNRVIKKCKNIRDAVNYVDVMGGYYPQRNKFAKKRRIEHEDAYFLAKYTNLDSATSDLLENRTPDFWAKVVLGTDSDTNTIMSQALSIGRHPLGLTIQLKKLITEKDINVLQLKRPALKGNYTNLSLDKDGNLVFPGLFNVNIKTCTVSDKVVTIITNNDKPNEQYIAYKGAIAEIKGLKNCSKKSFVNYARLDPIQADILAYAAEKFPIDIIDNRGNCIIGTGIDTDGKEVEPFNSEQHMDDEIMEHYGEVLTKLKQDHQLTIANILKILPRTARLQISPYITPENGKMLYSIASVFETHDGTKWQFRIHSTDIDHPDNSDLNSGENSSDWIFRLGHEVYTPNGKTYKFFEFDDSEKGYNYNGDFNGLNCRNSHVKIQDSELENNKNLIFNIHFQNIIRQISATLSDNEIISFAKKIGAGYQDTQMAKKDIVSVCLKHPEYYLANKELVDNLRKDLGLLDLK